MLRRLLDFRPLRMIVTMAMAVVLAFGLGAAAIAIDGLTDSAAPSDVVVVLGNEVRADGTPAPRLVARLDAAVDVHTAGLAENIIVSGGVGKTGFNEAEVMASYLAESGIDSDRIVIDPTGVNTRATAENASRIMEDEGWRSAIVATQFFHISRSRMALKQAGIDPVTTVHADYHESRDFFGLGREVPAYIKYWFGA